MKTKDLMPMFANRWIFHDPDFSWHNLLNRFFDFFGMMIYHAKKGIVEPALPSNGYCVIAILLVKSDSDS